MLRCTSEKFLKFYPKRLRLYTNEAKKTKRRIFIKASHIHYQISVLLNSHYFYNLYVTISYISYLDSIFYNIILRHPF